MWNMPKRQSEECRRVKDSLEEAAERDAEAVVVEKWIAQLTAEERTHIEKCGDCRAGAEDLAATKKLFRGVPSFTNEERPWFTARVMGAIAVRERELAQRLSAWNEFPRFAARLAWVTGVLLLVGTTLFYEKVVQAPRYKPNGTTQESIFEAPQQTSQDDILISMAGNNP